LALFPYQGPVVALITQLKFRHQLSHAQLLGTLLAERVQAAWYQTQPLPDVILPVPIHAERLRERGFNQTVEIGRPLAAYLDIPLDRSGAIRHRATAAQSGLTATERRHNVANAFTVTRDYRNLTVAILDDVITTGHTIRAFSKAVEAAGATEIHVWCCARAS
jgi:ComF family protein